MDAHRASSVRRVRGIHAYRSAEKDGEWFTMTEAAKALAVTNHTIRRLIKAGVLPAIQVVSGAPFQFRADDLASDKVNTAMARKGRPYRTRDERTLPMITDLDKRLQNGSGVAWGRMERSTMLVSPSMRPPSRKQTSPSQ